MVLNFVVTRTRLGMRLAEKLMMSHGSNVRGYQAGATLLGYLHLLLCDQ